MPFHLLSEFSLRQSKCSSLKNLVILENVDVDEAVEKVMKIKSISPEVHPQYVHLIHYMSSGWGGVTGSCCYANYGTLHFCISPTQFFVVVII